MYFLSAIAPCAVPLSTSSTVKSELYQNAVGAISKYILHIIFYGSDLRYGVTDQHRCTLDQQCGACTWVRLRWTCSRWPNYAHFTYEVSIEVSIMDSCVHQAISSTFSSRLTEVAHLYCVLLFW